MNTHHIIAELVIDDLNQRIKQNRANENQLLVISDLSFAVLESINGQLETQSNSSLIVEQHALKTIVYDRNEIIPYLINESDPAGKQSQAFAGKLRNSMEAAPSLVKWLVIMGEPKEVEIDTFTSTGVWLVESPSKKKSYFDKLFEKHLASGGYGSDIKDRMKHLRSELFKLPLTESNLHNMLQYLLNVTNSGNNLSAMAKHLNDLGLIPSLNEDATKQYNLRKNRDFCVDISKQIERLEDIDFWIEENVQEETRTDLRELVRDGRTNPAELVQTIGSRLTLEKIVNLEEPEVSPFFFEKKNGLTLTEGVKPFLKGNTKILEIIQSTIKMQYSLTRPPYSDHEQVALSINDGSFYPLDGICNKDGELEIDLQEMKILEALEEDRVYKLTIGIVDPDKPNRFKKNSRGKTHQYSYFVYPNLSNRTWNVYEVNEELEFRGKQCVFNWEDQLTFVITGDITGAKASLYLDAQVQDPDDVTEDNESLDLPLTIEGRNITISASELKQLRKRAFSDTNDEQDEVTVELVVQDSQHSSLTLSFLLGAESDLTSIPVRSIQEAIIHYLHQGDKDSLRRDRTPNTIPFPFEIKMLGNLGDQIRFRVFQEEGDDSDLSPYSIHYPSLLREIEKDLLSRPDYPFPREYKNGKVEDKFHPNWETSFSGDVSRELDVFLVKRKALFEALHSSKGLKSLLTVNLLPYQQLIDDYLYHFKLMLNIISEEKVMEQHTGIMLMDTIFTQNDQVIFIAPTHPLKLKAALTLQQHVEKFNHQLPQSNEDFAYTSANILQWNHQQVPPFLNLKQDDYYRAYPSPYLFWGFYQIYADKPLAAEDNDLLTLFTKKNKKNKSQENRVANAIDKRIEIFLQSYPFLKQQQLPISINCFLAKDSGFIFDAIYELAARNERISWKVNFIITDSEDAQKQKIALKKSIKLFREEVLRTEDRAHILRNIDYTIQVVDLKNCTKEEIPYAHVSLLSNLFETKIKTHPVDAFNTSIVNEELTAIPKTYYSYKENSFFTGVTLPGVRSDFEDVIAKYMSVIACHTVPYQDNIALFSQTNLQRKEMEKINKIVGRSIWVCFLEKGVGVEKFDSNMESDPYYLVDYLNKYSSEIEGFDLLTITQGRKEIISLIQNHLYKEKYNVASREDSAKTLLHAINCLSGRWALRLIGGSMTEVSGLIGSLQVFMFYKNIIKVFEPHFDEDRTSLSVLVPLDEYMGVMPRRLDGWFEQNREENYKACSDDYLLFRIEERNGKLLLIGKIIEVKFSKDKATGQVISKAKEQVYNTLKVLEDRFNSNKINRAFKQTELAEMIYFHVMKFMRNNVYSSDEDLNAQITSFMGRVYDQILASKFELHFTYYEPDTTSQLIGEIITVNPAVQNDEGYEVRLSDNRRIIHLYDSTIQAIYNAAESGSAKFNRLKRILNPDFVIDSPDLQTFSTLEDSHDEEKNSEAYQTPEVASFTMIDESTSNEGTSEFASSSQESLTVAPDNERSALPSVVESTINEDNPFIHLGMDMNGDNVLFTPKVLTKHVAVLGSTGSGKTRLAKAFVEEVTRLGIPSIIIDPQGDIARLIQSAGKTSPLAKEFYEKAEVRIFTPASNKGIQFSFSPIQMPKVDVLAQISDPLEREEYLTTVFDSTASNLLSVLSKRDDQVHAFMVIVLEKLYRMGITTDVTIDSLAQYIHKSHLYPLEMSDDDIEMYIAKSSKSNLVRDLITLTVGTNKALFNLGFKFDIDTILKPVTPGKVPINVVYLNSLDSDQKKQFCVSVICNEMYKWMLQNPSSDLQLAFYIDEVGPYMPPQNVKKPASKDILLRLYKESRKYGIGCIMCTQNPGDVDSKILNNANTWCIGKIIPKHFESIKKLIDDSGSDNTPDISEVSNFKSGEFIVVSSEAFGKERFKQILVRDLYTVHQTPYTLEEVEEITPSKLREAFSAPL